MLTEKIKEPVKVLAFFNEGSIRLVSFEWRNQKFERFEVVSSWVCRIANSRAIFFSVSLDGDFYELCFRMRTMSWYLVRIISP